MYALSIWSWLQKQLESDYFVAASILMPYNSACLVPWKIPQAPNAAILPALPTGKQSSRRVSGPRRRTTEFDRAATAVANVNRRGNNPTPLTVPLTPHSQGHDDILTVTTIHGLGTWNLHPCPSQYIRCLGLAYLPVCLSTVAKLGKLCVLPSSPCTASPLL